MRLGEALATCPQLVLVEPDPAAAEQAWEEIVRSLEDAGFAVEPAAARHRVLRDARGRAAVRRPRAGAPAGARRGRHALGCAHRRGRPAVRRARGRLGREAGPAARRARRGGRALPRAAAADACCRSSGSATKSSNRSECEGLDSLPGSRVAPSPNDWGRTAGAPGAWREAERPRACAVAVRRPSSRSRSSSPRRSANELTLRRALGALVETALARPERRDRFVRKVALAARLVGGGSWRRTLTLREPSADAEPHPHRARTAARRAAGARARAAARARRADRARRAASSSCSPPAPRTAAA